MKNIDFFNTIKTNSLLQLVFDYNPLIIDDLQDYIDGFEDSIEEDIVNKTNWLYSGDGYLTVVLGPYKDNIIAISEDFELFKFCDYFQDIPFEIYRRNFGVFDSRRENHLECLKQYEQWCKDNNIVVDPNNYYHDENGEIFKEHFELDYDQSIIGLY